MFPLVVAYLEFKEKNVKNTIVFLNMYCDMNKDLATYADLLVYSVLFYILSYLSYCTHSYK